MNYMNNDDKKKEKDIEDNGHDATRDELEPLEPAAGAAENGGENVIEIPEVVDHFVVENEFPSEPSNADGD
jgi:hypothetical protein